MSIHHDNNDEDDNRNVLHRVFDDIPSAFKLNLKRSFNAIIAHFVDSSKCDILVLNNMLQNHGPWVTENNISEVYKAWYYDYLAKALTITTLTAPQKKAMAYKSVF